MTGDDFGRELQRLRDVQVAEAVAAVVERIAVALESAPWADEGPYARDAAALARSFASAGPAFEREGAGNGSQRSAATRAGGTGPFPCSQLSTPLRGSQAVPSMSATVSGTPWTVVDADAAPTTEDQESSEEIEHG